MNRTYFFISIKEVVKIYEQTEDMLREIPTAVKYNAQEDSFWTWFENNVGELEGNAAYFLSDEKTAVPKQIQETQETYSLNLLKSTVKALFLDCTVEVHYGESQSFALQIEGKEQIFLYLCHPNEAIDELEEELIEKEEPEINLYTGEKSDLKRAFEGIYQNYHTNNGHE